MGGPVAQSTEQADTKTAPDSKKDTSDNSKRDVGPQDQLDELIKITRPRMWVALVGLGVLVGAIVMWGFFGTLDTKVTGSGVLMRGSSVLSAGSLIQGIVIKSDLEPGVDVRKDQVIAVVQDPQGNAHDILSPADGRVQRIHTRPGDFTDIGSPVLTIEPKGPLQAIVFVPLASAKVIRPGMPVRITVSIAPAETYGYLLGTVRQISPYAVGSNYVASLLDSQSLAQTLTQGQPTLEVAVNLKRDRSTPSGFDWSSGDGPNQQLSSGTLVTGDVIAGQHHPINLIVQGGTGG